MSPNKNKSTSIIGASFSRNTGNALGKQSKARLAADDSTSPDQLAC
jgi:hypothetical protein